MGKQRDYRADTGRARQPMTRKEIMIQLGICIAILLFFSIQETFWPNMFGKNEETPAPTTAPIENNVGTEVMDLAAVQALTLQFPVMEDRNWFVYVIGEGEARTYTLISSNVTDRTTAALQKPGYEIGTSVRINLKGTDALAEVLQKVQTGDTLTVIGADGLTVSAADYALIADGANKSGLKVSLQQAEQTPAA